jgi:hypothetical protein
MSRPIAFEGPHDVFIPRVPSSGRHVGLPLQSLIKSGFPWHLKKNTDARNVGTTSSYSSLSKRIRGRFMGRDHFQPARWPRACHFHLLGRFAGDGMMTV